MGFFWNAQRRRGNLGPPDRQLNPAGLNALATSSSASSSTMSSSTLQHNPSLDVDYTLLDAEDPSFELGWLASFLLFGLSGASADDPKYRAVAKLHRLTVENGIQGVKVPNYFIAFRVYAVMVDRQAKAILEEQRRMERFEESLSRPPAFSLQQLAISVVRKRPRARPFVSADSLSDPPAEPRRWSLGEIGDLVELEAFAARRWSVPEAVLSTSHEVLGKKNSESIQGSTGRLLDKLQRETSRNSLETQLSLQSDDDKSKGVLSSARQVTAEHVQLLYHMLRHAESVYGFPLTVASAPRVSLTKVTKKGIISSRTGVSPVDLKVTSFSTTAFLPAHYVAVDRHIRAIVICVRGTANLVDSLTDFAATYDPMKIRRSTSGEGTDFLEGYGHAGVLRSARNLFQRIRGKTLAAIKENPDFSLFITGHSLGAAIAAVLALIMRGDCAFPNALAFCFAPLPCMTLELAEQSAEFAITVVNGPDIVPRLGISQMLPYIATAQYVARLTKPRKTLVVLGMHNAAIDWEDLEAHNSAEVEKLKKKHEGQRLHIPGKVFQLVHKNEVHRREAFRNRLFRRRNVEVVPVPRTQFLEVRSRDKKMFMSHAPYSYKSKLRLVLKGMDVGPLRWMSGGSVFRNLLLVPVARLWPPSSQHCTASESLDNLVERLVVRDGSPIPEWAIDEG